MGLDLPIAYLVARLCGGDLTCENSPSDGTVFAFTLPLFGTMSPTVAARAHDILRDG